MKYSRLIAFSYLLLFCTVAATAQVGPGCPIDNLEVEADTCTSDSTYNLFVNLDYQVATDSFELYIDEEYYGTFLFQELPLHIDDAQGDGGPHDQIRVCHADIPDCCRVSGLDVPDCILVQTCKIEELELDVYNCANDTFFVKLSFDIVNPASQGFTLKVNGLDFGTYDYADLPVDAGPIVDAGNDVHFEVVDLGDPQCSEEESLDSPVCGGGQDCEIEDFEVTAVNCLADTFYVEVNFEYEETGANGFHILVNGADSGNYDYAALPIVLGPFVSNGNDWEFAVEDADFAHCSDAETLEDEDTDCQVNADCKIHKLQLEVLQCTSDSSFELVIDFERENASDSFILYANGAFFNLYAYDSLPLTINFPSNDHIWDHVVVCDLEDNFCCKHGKVRVPDCIDIEECKIGGLYLSPTNCRSDSFDLEVWFVHRNASSTFDLEVNGSFYGNYQYDNLPLEIGPFEDDGNPIAVQVTDVVDPECTVLESLDDFDCSVPDTMLCHIDSIAVFVGNCTSDETYTITVDFQFDEVSDSFDVFGVANIYLGRYSYGDLPITITDYPSNGGKFDHVKICNVGPPNCCKVGKFNVPGCVEIDPPKINKKDFVNIFPNPGKVRMFVQLDDKVKVRRAYLLVPGSGQVDLHLNERKNGIDVSGYQPGLYFLVLETEEGRIIKQFIISE